MDAKFKERVLQAMKSDEDVMFVWSRITSEIDEAGSKYLFNSIVNLYFTTRGNRFSKSVLERYKRSEKKTIQKSQGLRKKINN